MESLLRNFWIVFVVVTVVNGRTWWRRVQRRIQSDPELEPGYRWLYRGYLFWANVPWVFMGIGILTGQVNSMFDFLSPNEGNPFVLAWWGMLGGLLCLGTYWICFAGGAEMLESHPGVYMVPQWSASKLRLLWLGGVAWNVAIATLLFLGFPSKAPDSPTESTWSRAIFPFFFVGLWLLVSFLLSSMGGWRALAQHYLSRTPHTGKRFRFRSAQFGGFVNYGACLTIGAGPDGLYLSVLPFFRFAHPPLLIPWADVAAREVQSWLSSSVELEFAKVPGTSVRFSRRLADPIFAASGYQVLVHRAAG